jgi:hypothetical protein
MIARPRAVQLALCVAPLCAWLACGQLREGPAHTPPGDASGSDATGDDATDASPDAGLLPSTFSVVMGAPVGQRFQAVWAADPQNVFVAGTGGVHEDYADGTWTRQENTTGRDYYALWGTSANDVYAVGEVVGDHSGVIQHYDGLTWTDEYLAPTALYGVWGTGKTSKDVVLAVGAKGMVYGKFVGTTSWADHTGSGLPANPDVPAGPDSPILRSISGIDFSNFLIAADQDRIFHFLASLMTFEWLDPAPDTSIVFRNVWQAPLKQPSAYFGMNYFGIGWYTTAGPAQFDALAVDDADINEYLFVLNEDQSEPTSAQKFIRGIWGTATSVVFCGDDGRIYSYAVGTDNTARVQSPTDASLWAASGTGPKDVWLVGDREVVLHGSLPQ